VRSSALHPAAWSSLWALQRGSAHAVLLHGPAGMAKTELAMELAAGMLCERAGPDGACGHCLPCNWFRQGNHPDFRLLRPDSDAAAEGEGAGNESGKGKPSREIRVDQVRALAEFLNVSAHRAGRRVVLANPAEAMNRNTANAILKVLEEPNPGVFFILVSNDFDSLLPTLKSRCLKQGISRPQPARALAWLADHGVTKDAMLFLSRAGGAPGLALEIAKGAEGRLLEILEGCWDTGNSFDSKKAAFEVERVLRSEGNLEMMTVIAWTQRWLVDGLLSTLGMAARYFPDRKSHFPCSDSGSMFSNIDKCNEFKVLSKHPLNTRLFLESFFEQCMPKTKVGNR
jgi:DNA polymerase III subunit delta'